MSSSQARQTWRDRRTKIVTDFCTKYGMSVNPLNNGYQLRIENLVDIYPTNGRYCILQSGERGGWHNRTDLKELMLRVIPAHGIKTYDINRGEQPITGIELTGVNKVTEIPVGEWPRRMGSRAFAQVTDDPNTVNELKTDGYIKPRPPMIFFDEAADWKWPKWYRNPIGWWKFRKLMKTIERNRHGSSNNR